MLKHDPYWSAPVLWRSEFRNVLSFYLRKKIIAYPDALQIMEQAEDLMENKEYEVPSGQILNLVRQSNCSAYDCEFVYLARKLEIPLISADKKILIEFPDNCISLVEFI